MTLTIDVPDAQAAILTEMADSQGVTAEQCAQLVLAGAQMGKRPRQPIPEPKLI